MANEIQIIHDDGAETVYAIVRDMAGLWYVATTGEAFTLANWATYDIAMTEVDAIGAGVSGALQGTFPAVAAGYYWVDFYVQAGGAPASTDAPLSSILCYWNATTLIPAEAIIGTPAGASVSADIAAVKAETVLILEDTGTTLPAQISGIGTVGGAAISTDVEDDNYDGGISGVTSGTTKVGTQTATYASTSVLDGTSHVMTHAAQEVDIVYQFLAGGGASPVGITWTGYLNPNGDTLTFQMWDHVTGDWESVGTQDGQSGSTNKVKNIVLYARHMGTSAAELGKVYLRLVSSEAYNHIIGTDQVYLTYAITSRSIGYADGAVWVDTNNGTAGAVKDTNGVADNPSSNWTDAQAIAAALGTNKFRFIAGSSITLDATAANKEFIGSVTIALGGQIITNALFEGTYSITGISSGQDAQFCRCGIGTASTEHAYFTDCRFTGTYTMLTGTSKDFFFVNCTDAVSGGAGGNATFVYVADAQAMFRDWRGGLQLNNHKATNSTLIDGAGRLIIDGTSDAGDITIRGDFPVATGYAAFEVAGTITQTQRFGTDQALADSTGVTETLTRLPDATAGAAGGVAIVGSEMGLADAAITAAKIDTDAIAAAAIKADAVTKIQDGLATPTNITKANGISLSDNAITAAKIAAFAIEAIAIKSDAVDKIQDGLATPTNITAAEGVILASNGLDSVSTTGPTNAASNFREMVVQTWRRFFKKATKTDSAIVTYADDGSTAVTTQAVSDDGSTETQGPATTP